VAFFFFFFFAQQSMCITFFTVVVLLLLQFFGGGVVAVDNASPAPHGYFPFARTQRLVAEAKRTSELPQNRLTGRAAALNNDIQSKSYDEARASLQHAQQKQQLQLNHRTRRQQTSNAAQSNAAKLAALIDVDSTTPTFRRLFLPADATFEDAIVLLVALPKALAQIPHQVRDIGRVQFASPSNTGSDAMEALYSWMRSACGSTRNPTIPAAASAFARAGVSAIMRSTNVANMSLPAHLVLSHVRAASLPDAASCAPRPTLRPALSAARVIRDAEASLREAGLPNAATPPPAPSTIPRRHLSCSLTSCRLRLFPCPRSQLLRRLHLRPSQLHPLRRP
jgi:hypothetical protein